MIYKRIVVSISVLDELSHGKSLDMKIMYNGRVALQ